MNQVQALYNSVKENFTIERVSKIATVSLIVSICALTALASIALIFSSASTPLSLLGAAICVKVLTHLCTLPHLIEEHNMLRNSDNYKRDIRNFIAASLPNLTESVALYSLFRFLNK